MTIHTDSADVDQQGGLVEPRVDALALAPWNGKLVGAAGPPSTSAQRSREDSIKALQLLQSVMSAEDFSKKEKLVLERLQKQDPFHVERQPSLSTICRSKKDVARSAHEA